MNEPAPACCRPVYTEAVARYATAVSSAACETQNGLLQTAGAPGRLVPPRCKRPSLHTPPAYGAICEGSALTSTMPPQPVAARYAIWYQRSMTRVCKLQPSGEISFPEVADDPTAMQDLLGGYMEPFPLAPDLASRGLMALADEEGLLKRLPVNVYSPELGRVIVGPVVIVRTDPPEIVDLTDEDIDALGDHLGWTTSE